MNKQQIIDKLKSSKLFRFDNDDYTERLIKFLILNKTTNKELETGNIALLFNRKNENIIRNFFSDAQADGNIWYGVKELAQFANISYDDDEDYDATVDDICSRFMCKIKRIFNLIE